MAERDEYAFGDFFNHGRKRVIECNGDGSANSLRITRASIPSAKESAMGERRLARSSSVVVMAGTPSRIDPPLAGRVGKVR